VYKVEILLNILKVWQNCGIGLNTRLFYDRNILPQNNLRGNWKVDSRMNSEEKNLSLADALVKLDESWSRLSRQIAQELKAQYAAVPPGHLLLLQLLDAYGSQRMTELATMLGMSTSGTTLLVDRAIEGKLVKRERDAVDRRGVWVAIDQAGQDLLQHVRQLRAQLLVSYLPEVEAENVERFIVLLEKIAQSATNLSSRNTQ
jgi:DNA-binding MarR family transcriptional regulator